MIIQSLKFQFKEPFKANWTGLDEFKPLAIVIGRNNSGKSHFLNLVELMVEEKISYSNQFVKCTGILDREFLQRAFLIGHEGGGLDGDHWNDHGSGLVGCPVTWWNDANRSLPESLNVHMAEGFVDHRERTQSARLKCISSKLPGALSPLNKRGFRRLHADRDIRREPPSTKMELDRNGNGATNIIRRFLLSSSLPEELIQKSVCQSLDQIFGVDGTFIDIDIRTHDEDDMDDEQPWEVYVGEPTKGLIPLSRSGSGLKTILLILLNLLVMPTVEGKSHLPFVFIFEEPENNLHPALLRRLFKFIADFALERGHFVFMSTHSNVALDFFGPHPKAQIIHVTNKGGSTTGTTVKAHFDHVATLQDLGARPSDLLQANGIIWLEGPSDRVYVNKLIELFSDGEFREGTSYQCAIYGGSNLARTQFASQKEADETLINLLRVNNNIAVICDSDFTTLNDDDNEIKERVARIGREVTNVPGSFMWITEPKEIENYIPGSVWQKVFGIERQVHDPKRTDCFPSRPRKKKTHFVWRELSRKSFDKVEFAMKAAPYFTKENLANRFDLAKRAMELVDRIRNWNE